MTQRLRDIPFYPFLVLLHLVFTVFSLCLRVYELLATPAPYEEDAVVIDDLADTGGRGRSTSRIRRRSINPPRHVGMVLRCAPGPGGLSTATSSVTSQRQRKTLSRYEARQRTQVVECVLNLVKMAADEGVNELSIYEGSARSFKIPNADIATDLLVSVKQEIMSDLLRVPLSPPYSGPSSPGQDTVPADQNVTSNDGRLDLTYEDLEKTEDEVSTFSIFRGREFPVHLHHAAGIPSLLKLSDENNGSPSPQHPHRITIHLLPPATHNLFDTITQELVSSDIDVQNINQAMLHEKVMGESPAPTITKPLSLSRISVLLGLEADTPLERLHFSRDPDLLIIHDLQKPSGWRSWLPRPAPELGGYPFWSLRITEIYHHSPDLPLLYAFSPLLHLARTSTLPFLRKLGRLVPPPPDAQYGRSEFYDGPGRIGSLEWQGAMRAWEAVEQRLGR